MLARIWNGIASQDQADSYVRHFHETVLPELRAITGFQRAYLLRREHQNETQFTVFTLWESMEAIRSFAGPDPETAVVAPAAKAVLRTFDAKVAHFEVVRAVSSEQ